MKTKIEIAKDINWKGSASRTIKVDKKLDLHIGQEYNFFHEVESWGDKYSEFHVENYNEIEYFFTCDNIKGHKVDYENEEECEVLDCEGMENESEVLIHKETQKIIIENIIDGLDDVGYIEVQLKVEE